MIIPLLCTRNTFPSPCAVSDRFAVITPFLKPIDWLYKGFKIAGAGVVKRHNGVHCKLEVPVTRNKPLYCTSAYDVHRSNTTQDSLEHWFRLTRPSVACGRYLLQLTKLLCSRGTTCNALQGSFFAITCLVTLHNTFNGT